MSAKKPPTYHAGNAEAAGIILADPERHLAWPAPLSVEEIEASLMVRWARKAGGIDLQRAAMDGTVHVPRSAGAVTSSPSFQTEQPAWRQKGRRSAVQQNDTSAGGAQAPSSRGATPAFPSHQTASIDDRIEEFKLS